MPFQRGLKSNGVRLKQLYASHRLDDLIVLYNLMTRRLRQIKCVGLIDAFSAVVGNPPFAFLGIVLMNVMEFMNSFLIVSSS